MCKRTLTTTLSTCIVAAGVLCYGQNETTQKAVEPTSQNLTTKDGVQLKVVYFEGLAGNRTVPVVLIHAAEGPMGEGSGRDCMDLASYLQQQGHAVFVPDLRGYGESKKQTVNGEVRILNNDRFRRQNIEEMVEFDLEAVKKLIVQKHNEEKLNSEMLCLVGFEMGAVVALNWALLDWSIPSFPNLKQGQDVNAMVLVSPPQVYKGLTVRDAMANASVRSKISTMLIYGSQTPAVVKDGRRIFRSLERFHPPVPEDDREKRETQDLFQHELETSLQGTRLLTVDNLQVKQMINEFIQIRLVAKSDRYPWKNRSR